MAAYFAATFTVAYSVWLFYFTSLTCGGTSGEPTEKCDIRMWYLNKIGEGLFPQDLSEEQRTLKNTIENMIQKSTTNADLSNVDCSVLKTYESMFSTPVQNDSSDDQEPTEGETKSQETGDENVNLESDETEDDSDTDFDETEFTDIDETESEQAVISEEKYEQPQIEDEVADSVEEVQSQETVAEKETTMENVLDTCNGKTKNQTCMKKNEQKGRDKSESETNNNNENSQIDSDNSDDISSRSSSTSSKERMVESATDLPIESGDTKQNNAPNSKSKSGGVDINQFQILFEKTAGEYMLKIQTLEVQIMRLENDLLTDKLNKQNHSSSFTRLENQILKLENELLKMNLSYEELKEENEKIVKKQKSFLELDYVKGNGKRPGLTDNSTKQYDLIDQHQNKISELSAHLRNQSELIDKIKGQSQNLEDQNRMLFQIVMNQTMLISQIMKKVETLTDSNMKHFMQQQFLNDKLGNDMPNTQAMEDLQTVVSNQLPLANKEGKKGDDLEKVRVTSGQSEKDKKENLETVTPRQMPPLSRCKHPKICRISCGFNSLVLFQCLWNDNEIKETVDTPETLQSHKRQDTEENIEEDQIKSTKNDKKRKPNKPTTKDSKDKTSTETSKKTKSESKTSKKNVEKKGASTKKKLPKETGNGSKQENSSQNITENDNEQGEKSSKKEDAKEQKLPSETNSTKAEGEKKPTNGSQDDGNSGKKKTIVKHEKANDKLKSEKKTKNDGKMVKVERIPPLYNVTKQTEPKDCFDYYKRSKPKDGQFKIKLHGKDSLLPVFCDMKNGGWTVIQRRQDGTVNFFREWKDYKKGFGGLYGEHWIGNDNIHRLTNQDQYEMRVDLMAWDKTKKHAIYEYFRVDDEAQGYRLHVEGYSGDAGDGFSKHNGEQFSTKDKDNDRLVKEFGGSCANRFKGAWWYYKCYASNLNGKYYKGGVIPEKQFDGITWKPWTGPNVSLKKIEIKIRPIKSK